MEETTGEIVKEMEYLREREIKLRDTNESTNERVKWFAFGTMGMLVALGVWQVVYLRAYFRSVSITLFVSSLMHEKVKAFDLSMSNCSTFMNIMCHKGKHFCGMYFEESFPSL